MIVGNFQEKQLTIENLQREKKLLRDFSGIFRQKPYKYGNFLKKLVANLKKKLLKKENIQDG